jgi:site-specific DNA-methyltransferase (adenine-specific)
MRQALYFVDVCGFKMHDTMIWQKDGNPFPESNRYAQEFEYMFVFSKDVPKTKNLIQQLVKFHPGKSATYRQLNGQMDANKYGTRETRALPNVWYIPCGYMKTTTDIFAYDHPAMFPEKLAERHILTWSNPGDVVLDYFGGSGTTAKMARNNNRQYITCDLSAEYCDLMRKRLAQPFTMPMFE